MLRTGVCKQWGQSEGKRVGQGPGRAGLAAGTAHLRSEARWLLDQSGEPLPAERTVEEDPAGK